MVVLYGDYIRMRPNTQIWRGLVSYANAESIEANTEILSELARALWDSMNWMARTAFASESDVPDMIAQQVRPELGTITKDRPWVLFKSEKELADKFRQQAVMYQPEVRTLLRWLVEPRYNSQYRSDAFAFLREHTDHIEFQRGDPAFAAEIEELRYFASDGQLKDDFPHRTFLYNDMADVVCDFVQREHEAGRSVPMQICKRPECGNLVARFKKRQYCRTPSCDRERQKRDDDLKQKKNRDNVFLHRLRRLPSAARRKRIRESAERLREIQTYWEEKNEPLAKHALKLLAQIE